MLPARLGLVPGPQHPGRRGPGRPAGRTVAAGRNRCNEPGISACGPVGGSSIAHAEINALATLPPGEYGGHTLYSTLEPCFLCTAALRYAHVGTVRYAAEDLIWSGVDRLRAATLDEALAEVWDDLPAEP